MAQSIDTLLPDAEGRDAPAVHAEKLLARAAELFRSDPRQGLLCAEEALEIAHDLGNRAIEARCQREIACCRETLSEYANALAALQQALAINREIGEVSEVAGCQLLFGAVARSMGDYPAALEALDEALTIFDRLVNRADMARVYNNIGTVQEATGNYTSALEAFLAALAIDLELGEKRHAAVVGINIGNIYYYLGDNDRAFEHYSHSLELFRRLGESYTVAVTLGNIAAIYKGRGEFDAAREALAEAVAIAREIGDRRYEASILVKLGLLHEELGKPAVALKSLREAARIAVAIGSHDVLTGSLIAIGRLHNNRGEFHKALPSLRRGLAVAQHTSKLREASELQKMLAEALDALGNHQEAFGHMKEHAALQHTIYGEERQRAIAELQGRFDIERAEREREVFRLKSEHLEEMMRQRSNELTSMAMHLVRKNTFLNRLRQQLTAPESKAAGNLHEAMLHEIDENLRGDNDWQRFEQEFERIHQGFIQALSRRYPRLTPAELKICALLKINLSNKEITDLLSISLRNVESHRYAIRKKLGLSSEMNLSTYMSSL